MKSAFAIFCAIIGAALATTMVAAGTVEFDQTGGDTAVQITVEQPLSGRVGVFAYTYQSQAYSEAYAGLTYAPLPNIQLALGTGNEPGGSRIGGWIWAGAGNWSMVYGYEDGASGYCHKLSLKTQISEKVTIGVINNFYKGTVVLAEYRLSKTATLRYTDYAVPEVALVVGF